MPTSGPKVGEMSDVMSVTDLNGNAVSIGGADSQELATLILFIVGLLAGWGVKTVLHRLLKALRFDSLCERWGMTAAIRGICSIKLC